MDILAKLNSGQLHSEKRNANPELVDQHGNIHSSKERRAFVDWYICAKESRGDVKTWTDAQLEEYRERYVA